MNNIGIFLNNRIVDKKHFVLADLTVSLGNWCLSPVRCLFNGSKVSISYKNQILNIDHHKEYSNSSGYSYVLPKRNLIRVIASIVLIVPGLILGSAFKGLGYLSDTIRHRHQLAVRHFTPVHYTIGSPEKRLTLGEISQELKAYGQGNALNQPAKYIIVYAEEGTMIEQDPGFLNLNPQKIILVGARILHAPGLFRLDDSLCDNGWDSCALRAIRLGGPVHPEDTTLVTQRKMASVQAAIQDAPPKNLKRVYIV